jgi:hypothetical protein
MKRLLIIALLAFAAWKGFGKYQERHIVGSEGAFMPAQSVSISADSFKCDGRTYCSQMMSCAEATFFLQNCPDVKMDGDNDGVPCERQWCGQ